MEALGRSIAEEKRTPAAARIVNASPRAMMPIRGTLIASAVGTAIVLHVVVQSMEIEPAVVLGKALGGAVGAGAWYVQTLISEE